MEFRNERVKGIESKPGKPDKDTGERTYQIIVTCYATDNQRYGNRYSNFFTQAGEARAFGELEPEDYVDQDVKIGFVFRDWSSEATGKSGTARDLRQMSMRDRDVNAEQAVLGDTGPIEGTSNEKPPPGEGKGTPEPQKPLKTPVSRDLSIIRQVSWKCSVELMKAFEPMIGEDMEKNLEWAVKTAHAIEEDINR